MSLCCLCRYRLAEFSNDSIVKRWKVIRLAAGGQVTIGHDFFIYPVPACIPNVGPYGGPGRESLFLQHSRLHQHPWSVANSAHGLARVEEVGHEGDRLGFNTKFVRIDLTARQDKPVVVRGLGVIQRLVNLGLLTPVGMVPAFDLTGLGRYYVDRSSGRFQSFLLGSVSSTCSKPSVARIAIFFP